MNRSDENIIATEQTAKSDKSMCADGGTRKGANRRRIAFAVVALAWVAFDQVTKAQFQGVQLGRVVFGPVLGLFDFRLVYNTGGAWGVFSDATLALGVFSVLVCVAAAFYFVVAAESLNWAETIGFSLIVAGGIGNAIDRFLLGYVVDFIEFSFFDFPVFNVADIGVTCGFVLLIIGLLADYIRAAKAPSQEKEG